jgi:uncharacterized SAM-binding protein YcdF (DUF218 family)
MNDRASIAPTTSPSRDVVTATRTARLSRLRWPHSRFMMGILLPAITWVAIDETTLADRLMVPLLLADTSGSADAIVVAGAGVIGHCELNVNGLRRTILAAQLWHKERAPLLLFTGGAPPGQSCAVAEVMANFAFELGVPAGRVIVETHSRSTHTNASLSAPLLRAKGAQRLLLVTDRLHMRRFSSTFEREGFQIGRASVPVYAGHRDNVDMLLHGFREYVALAYYKTRGWLSERDVTKPLD